MTQGCRGISTLEPATITRNSQKAAGASENWAHRMVPICSACTDLRGCHLKEDTAKMECGQKTHLSSQAVQLACTSRIESEDLKTKPEDAKWCSQHTVGKEACFCQAHHIWMRVLPTY